MNAIFVLKSELYELCTNSISLCATNIFGNILLIFGFISLSLIYAAAFAVRAEFTTIPNPL